MKNPAWPSHKSRLITATLVFILSFAPLMLQAGQMSQEPLFKIERSKNANIIQYDAQIGVDGKLDKKKPVIGYWIRLAEQGQVKQLTRVQRTFAFGFKAKYHQANDSATVDMVADIGQSITVKRVNGHYMAVINLEDGESQLKKIYILAHGKGMSVKVEYVEIFGIDLATGKETYAKITP